MPHFAFSSATVAICCVERRLAEAGVEVVQRVAEQQDDLVVGLDQRAALDLRRAEQQHRLGADLRQAERGQRLQRVLLLLVGAVGDVEDGDAEAVGMVEELLRPRDQRRLAVALPGEPGVPGVVDVAVREVAGEQRGVVDHRLVEVGDDGELRGVGRRRHRGVEPRGRDVVGLQLQGADLGGLLLEAQAHRELPDRAGVGRRLGVGRGLLREPRRGRGEQAERDHSCGQTNGHRAILLHGWANSRAGRPRRRVRPIGRPLNTQSRPGRLGGKEWWVRAPTLLDELHGHPRMRVFVKKAQNKILSSPKKTNMEFDVVSIYIKRKPATSVR